MNIQKRAPTLYRYINTFGDSFHEMHRSLVLQGEHTNQIAEVVTIEMKRETLIDLSEQTAGIV